MLTFFTLFNVEQHQTYNVSMALFRRLLCERSFTNLLRPALSAIISSLLKKMRVRLAKIEDIPALQELIPESVRELSALYYSSSQIESALTHIFGVDSQLILDGTYFVAEAEEQIVACGGWSKRETLFGGDQSKKSGIDGLLDPGEDAARIRAFYVHPKWSRRGIGTRIIRCCEDAARQAGFLKIELVATLPGEPLYSAIGYRIIEPTEIRTPDGESLPAFRMEKDLE